MGEAKEIVVDRRARDEIFHLIVQYIAKEISDNQFLARFPRVAGDPLIDFLQREIPDLILDESNKSGYCELDERSHVLCRCAIFLRSDLPYRWRKENWFKVGWDRNAWPFVSMDELNKAKELFKSQSRDNPSSEMLIKTFDTDWRRVRRDEAIIQLDNFLSGKATADEVRKQILLSFSDSNLQDNIRLYLSSLPSTKLPSLTNKKTRSRIEETIHRCIRFLQTDQQCIWKSCLNQEGIDWLTIISGLLTIVMLMVMTLAGFIVVAALTSPPVVSGHFSYLPLLSGLSCFSISLLAVIGLIRLPVTLPRARFRNSVHGGSRKSWPFAEEEFRDTSDRASESK